MSNFTYKPKHFLNRELSWLAFNERVLQEAEDPKTPPLNQLQFLAIVSSNLDEFAMIRLASLRHMLRTGKSNDCPSGMEVREQIDKVAVAIRKMVRRQYGCFNEKVWPTLARSGLRRLMPSELLVEQHRHIEAVFGEQVYPLLTPLAVDDERKFSRVPDLAINVLLRLRGPAAEGKAERVAVVAIPATLPRMIVVPAEKHEFVLLEDVVLAFIGRLFQDQEILETTLFRATRDGDLSVEESKDEDYVASMSEVLIGRRESRFVRVELAGNASPWAERTLKKLLDVGDEEIVRIPGPLDLKAWWSLVNLPGLSTLRYPQWRPQPVAELAGDVDVWAAIRKDDILVHHPYETFDVVVRLLQEAAADRNVRAIKQVLYRTSGASKIIAALEQAAANGKQVSVLVELKARFDEARNIEWARRLERAGAQVVYGLSGLKVHAKALMIVRREPDRIRRYVHLATGNYNETTAQQYTDLGLITCDEDFGSDVAAFFNMVTGYSLPVGWRKIVAAPLGLRQRLLHLVRREIERAEAGRGAAIMAKLNSLSDPEMIAALYDASRAGVKIHLNVRGVCCLRPGVKGVSENIEVVSIVDRFLEHSRVLYFRNGGNEEVYLSSADWMPRNLDRRVELLFPIE
ncbi:MAG: polyphosphate kinase 1, partial [Phycisphaerae bacterium]|nr:polyphosphate kinase 1 [Phycisphaerae bacterium]